MSKIAKLKKQALEFEQKRQFDKALARYTLALQSMEESPDEADVGLYNRVGDLLLRQGSVAEAVDHYEKAVDLYADSGLFNNAIALCNKILRNAPGRSSVYYKLGKISAQKGFTSDARQNYLEYAGRMERTGERAEAFRALKEFVELCPDQEDIRKLVENQLALEGGSVEGMTPLRTAEDREKQKADDARDAVERAKTAVREAEQRRAAGLPTPKSSELVFIDLGDSPASPPRGGGLHRGGMQHPGGMPHAGGMPAARPQAPNDGPPLDLPFIDAGADRPPARGAPAPLGAAPRPATLDGFPAIAGGSGADLLALPDLVGPSDAMVADDVGAIARLGVGGSTAAAASALPGLERGPYDEFAVAPAAAPPAAPAPRPAELPHVELPQVELPHVELPHVELPHVEPPVVSQPPRVAPAAEVPPPEPAAQPAPAPEPAPSIDADLQALQDLSTPVTPAHHTEMPLILSDALPAPTGATAAPPAPTAWAPAAPAPFVDDEPLVIIRESEREGGIGWDDLAARADADVSDLSSPGLDVALTRPAANSPTSPLKRRIEVVRDRLRAHPRSADYRRELGELLLEDGDRAGGLRELEAAMMEVERGGDTSGARSIAEEILRLEPDSVHFHQKRVEYAFRSNDKPRLVDAYLELADCLMRSGELEKARSVYARVRELSPADSRADAALGAVGGAGGTAAVGASVLGAPLADRRYGGPPASGPGAPAGGLPATAPQQGDGDYVDLSAWLFEDEQPRSTRMVVYGVTEPKDGEQADFEEMLERFKQGVAANIDDADHESHYDLGIAYREMGLLDEAIAELQKALRTTGDRVRTYEALGQCFVDKGQHQVAASLLTHAVADSTGGDQMLVGILYLLGVSCEALGRWGEARSYYERVFAIDLQFRDVRERLAAAERAAS